MNICITNPQEIQRHMENLAWLSAKEENDVAIPTQPKPKKSWEQRPKSNSKSKITAAAEKMEKIRKQVQASLQLSKTVHGQSYKKALPRIS